MTNETGHILYAVKDGIARITIDRPEARNAFTLDMYRALAQCCERANADETVKAVILTGAGDKAFSAGTDISAFKDFHTAEDALRYEGLMEEVLRSIEACRAPTIAAIAGACTGGGGAIAACCDLRIGTEDMKFGFPIARTLGNCLSVSNLARLSALIGAARTKEMIFTARLIEADEALRIGLLSGVAPNREALDAHVAALAAHITQLAPLTLRATKEGLRRLQAKESETDDNGLIVLCYTSDDFREGMNAFLQKRKPDWKGR